ncbi:MAG: hypothetical protein DRG78_18855 [Epsilonproteobacteria bacterium]|nr:MAG: hypothetical protein DRG78_18855 [Campylobacterota bacterium]
MKFAVGLFVITLFISVATFMYFLLDEKGTFDKRFSFSFNTDSASSFSIGMPLKFSGFDIGVIDDIALKDDGTVNMTFSVNEENRKWISVGSTLIIKKPLIGSPHIVIHSIPGNRPLEENSILTLQLSDDINDMISKLEPVVDKIEKIITSVETITAYIAQEDSYLMKTLQNIEKLTANMANEKSFLTTITGNSKSTDSLISSLNRSDKIMYEFQKVSKDLSKLTASLDKKIMDPASSSIKELDAIMKDVKKKLETLDGTVKTMGSYDKELVHLKDEISVGLQKSNQIMDKIDALMQDESQEEISLP